MARYVWRDGDFREPQTNQPMPLPDRDGVCCPMIQSDIADYISPIDGSVITSRSKQRYDLEKNDCVLSPPPKKPRGYRNQKFALKRGLKLNDEARDNFNRSLKNG